ncbi:hypothetical protein F4819DRAFT_454245 [Hypoxylon fuscum]|nr:hypothetical protein F4819DRAFT_454245 [Hypoxylon fuscum]
MFQIRVFSSKILPLVVARRRVFSTVFPAIAMNCAMFAVRPSATNASIPNVVILLVFFEGKVYRLNRHIPHRH